LARSDRPSIAADRAAAIEGLSLRAKICVAVALACASKQQQLKRGSPARPSRLRYTARRQYLPVDTLRPLSSCCSPIKSRDPCFRLLSKEVEVAANVLHPASKQELLGKYAV